MCAPDAHRGRHASAQSACANNTTDEPRRSGRATKGQHKNASSSPAPQPKPAKGKAQKKSKAQPEEDEDDDGVIRCICGNDDPNDKRAFISCDTCEVWQHNICMGEPEDEDDLPDHYYCEECAPEVHGETLQAMERGEKIWEARNKIAQNEKKMGKSRKGKKGPAGWLKKPVTLEENGESGPEAPSADSEETGSKRKREEIKEEPQAEEKASQPSRQDKRRKSAAPDAETAVIEISSLPKERQRTANALSKIIGDDVNARVKAGAHKLAEGETAKSTGDRFASLIEYELTMNYGETTTAQYSGQFRTLHANLKKNKALVERLLDGSLTAAELATMSSQDMASDELQKQRAQMKEQLERQSTAIEQSDGPKYRRTHKGDEIIEDENQQQSAQAAPPVQPVRERTSVAEGEDGGAASPPHADAPSPVQQPPKLDTTRPPDAGPPRRQSSQQFDMSSIWAKTAQSPTSATQPRPMQMPPRRRSSVKPTPDQQDSGTKEDADVDRMLQDDDDSYLPADVSTNPNQVIWRGKLIQTADSTEPRVSARFVAGRDIASTVSWPELLGSQLSIDGRLSITKAEEYLLSLAWSSTVDISVLALSPIDDQGAFNTVFEYFQTRERYAVVNKDKPAMVRDLYIIPLEVGAELPAHVVAMEYSSIRKPAEERMLLATFVVNRSPDTPTVAQQQSGEMEAQMQHGQQSGQTSANGHHLPVHLRAGGPGPAGSPINAGHATFSPTQQGPQQSPQAHAGYGMPPNPYTHQGPAEAYHRGPPQNQPPPPQSSNPLVNEILGGLQHAPSAQAILNAKPDASREQLVHLRQILDEDPTTRTNLEALSMKLFAEGR